MAKTINKDLILKTTFGVEVEMTGITRESAARVAAALFETGRVSHLGGSYDQWAAYDNNGREWLFVRDGSIVARDPRCKCELNTPPLTYENDIELLQSLIRKLRGAGAVSGPQYGCGIHVHVSGKGHTPTSISNWVSLVYSNYDLVYKSLGVTPERKHWCKDFSDGRLADIDFVEKFKRADTFSKQADAWYGNFAPHDNRSAHYNSSRYHLLNLHRFFSTLDKPSNTVEIRAFNASLHAGEIRSYVLLVLSMNAQALTQSSVKVLKNPVMVAGNEKFAMRTWLNRMGWTGEMFKTPHALFIKRLQGDSAWRFGKDGNQYRG